MNFEIKNVGEICKKVCSGGTPTSSNTLYYNGGIPWLNTNEVNFTDIYSTNKTISQLGLDNSAAKYIPANSVIVAMYGVTAGKCAVTKIPLTTNQACCNLVIDEKKAFYRYVYYYLKTQSDFLNKLANGGAQQNLNSLIIKKFKIPLPQIDYQKRIASILSAYDNLIENNNKRIKLLEQMAENLYKEWFVRFRFPGHETTPFENGIPKDWSIIEIGKRFETVLGGTPSRDKPEYWNGKIPWINSGEANKNRIINGSEFITEDGYNHSSTELLPVHSTIIAITGATLGQVSFTEIKVCTNQSIVGIYDKTEKATYYLFGTIKRCIEDMINYASGGAQQHINKDVVNKYNNFTFQFCSGKI